MLFSTYKCLFTAMLLFCAYCSWRTKWNTLRKVAHSMIISLFWKRENEAGDLTTLACLKRVHSNRNRDPRYLRILQSTNFVLIRYVILYPSRLCLVRFLLLCRISDTSQLLLNQLKKMFLCVMFLLRRLFGQHKGKTVESALIFCRQIFSFVFQSIFKTFLNTNKSVHLYWYSAEVNFIQLIKKRISFHLPRLKNLRN